MTKLQGETIATIFTEHKLIKHIFIHNTKTHCVAAPRPLMLGIVLFKVYNAPSKVRTVCALVMLMATG